MSDLQRPGSPPVTVRAARPEDVEVIVGLVKALADYEGARDEVKLGNGDLMKALFGEDPRVFAHVAEHDGAIVGMAIWFLNFSTWTGRHGIYLEDIFVAGPARGLGVGRALVRELAAIAMAKGYTRLEWAVLNWNEPAIGFYHHLGARPQDEWRVFRLSGESISTLAEGP